MDLLAVMQKRRSIRNYTDEIISRETVEQVLQAGLLAPSSRNHKPCEFITVQDRDRLQKLSKAKAAGSGMLAQAACAIVVLADAEKSDVWTEDAAIAMTYMHLMAVNLGLGSCWIQCRLRESQQGNSTEDYVRQLLSVPSQYRVEAILSLGVPEEPPIPYVPEPSETAKLHQEIF